MKLRATGASCLHGHGRIDIEERKLCEDGAVVGVLEICTFITSIGDFKTHKKECSTLIRRVKLLIPLFEEVRDLKLTISEEDLACFNALEAALNNAKILLLLCNTGSKLYLVLEQQEVAKQFLLLAAAFRQALNKPLSLDISDEVREQVDLVRNQFQRSKSLEDPLDAHLNSELLSVLSETHDCSKDKLKGLADMFKFDTARALMKELQALDGMKFYMGLHEGVPSSTWALDGIPINERGFDQLYALLNDLRSLFPSEELEQDGPELKKLQIAQRAGVEKASMQPASPDAGIDKGVLNIPDDFKCPISLDLMRDPVIIATGQTFERLCIQKWLDSGKKTCPKTGLSLPHTHLTPNHVLRSVIAEWCTLYGVEMPKKRAKGSQCSPEDKAAIDELVKKLSSPLSEVQRNAAYDLRLRAKKNVDHRSFIAEQGAIPLLVRLLHSPDQKTQEHSVTALLNLSINESNKGRIMTAGAIEPIVEVLKSGCMDARENAAATLFSLSLVDANKVTIGGSGAIPALVALLYDGTSRGKKDAATALFNLSIFQGNKSRAVQAGVVPPLMKLLEEQPVTMLDEALAILAILATHPDGRSVISAVGPTPIWLKIIQSESPRNKENAASILLALCSYDPEYAKQARETNAAELLTALATSREATNRAKRKATALLDLLKKQGYEDVDRRVEGLNM
nr:U-box domain-containing protein 13-like isoform X4 [Physcomitrium patens]|eukprot:XP_024362904.1 U-box domain-containing protein 13-like isoform X4 [Physcomitrella patens]